MPIVQIILRNICPPLAIPADGSRVRWGRTAGFDPAKPGEIVVINVAAEEIAASARNSESAMPEMRQKQHCSTCAL
jgi:hypothetical protein